MDCKEKYLKVLSFFKEKIEGRETLIVSKEDLETLFDELKESEDEKIRKELIRFHKSTIDINGIKGEDIIAWLEKQGGKESDIRYKYLDELLAADDIYQMSMNEAMTNEARTKAVSALSKMCISELLGLEKQGEPTKINPSNLDIRKANERGIDWDALRNQAAVAAMQGTITILSSSDRGAFREVVVEGFRGEKKTIPNIIAHFAVACAKSLIAELKKEANAELSQPVTKTGDKEWSKQDELFLQVCKNALAKYQTTDQWDSNIISQWLKEKLKQ